jgi:hypothetical protein
LENLETKNEDERRGVQIIQNALKVVLLLRTTFFFVTLRPFSILTSLPGNFSLFLIMHTTFHRHQHIL